MPCIHPKAKKVGVETEIKIAPRGKERGKAIAIETNVLHPEILL
jgi:hypothetical protein